MENNPFINELNTFTINEDKTNQAIKTNTKMTKENKECLDDLIKNMETDQGLLNIIKNYQEYEEQKRIRQESEVEEESENSKLFSNCLIQSSFNKFNNLKRIVLRKESVLIILFFDKWKMILKQ